MPVDELITTIAWDTLGMNNRDAWLAMKDRLEAEGVTGPEVEVLRRVAWNERKRLRAAEREERRGVRAAENRP